MEVSKYFPIPSDRMGFLWTLTSIEGAYVIEFGPAGTTHFALEGVMELNAEHRMNVFTTHMSEVDITFGMQDKLVGAIKEVDNQHKPKYIFVMASSISSLIGTDIESICYELESEINAKLIPISYGGYDGDYNLGIERALFTLVKELVKENESIDGLYNIIGCNIDQYNFLSDKTEIESMMQQIFGLKLNTCFTAYTSIEEIEKAAQAKYNIVLRAEGVKSAEYMKKAFGIPYIYKKPYGISQTMLWIKEIAESFNLKINIEYIKSQCDEIKGHASHYKTYLRNTNNKNAIIYSEYDCAIGIASLLEDLGLTAETVYVNHSALTDITVTKNLLYKPTESQLEEQLKSEYYAAFGDDTVRKMSYGKSFFHIANPNMDKYNFYTQTPLVGFNGTLNLLQQLMNFERSKSMNNI